MKRFFPQIYVNSSLIEEVDCVMLRENEMHRSLAVLICLIIPAVAMAAPIPRKTYLREVTAIIREVDRNQAAYATRQHENAQASSMYMLRVELDLYILKHELFRYRHHIALQSDVDHALAVLERDQEDAPELYTRAAR
jgi:hypothetical protein